MKSHRVKRMSPRLLLALQVARGHALECCSIGPTVVQELLAVFPDVDGDCDKTALARFQNKSSQWAAAMCDDGGKAWIADLELKVPSAMNSASVTDIEDLFHAAVAAMAPPRARAIEDVQQAADAVSRLQRGLQKRLRELVLNILEHSRLSFTAAQNLPAVRRLQHLLEVFVNRDSSGDLQSVYAGRQWARLQACLGHLASAASSQASSSLPPTSTQAPPSHEQCLQTLPSFHPTLVERNAKVLSSPGVQEVLTKLKKAQNKYWKVHLKIKEVQERMREASEKAGSVRKAWMEAE